MWHQEASKHFPNFSSSADCLVIYEYVCQKGRKMSPRSRFVTYFQGRQRHSTLSALRPFSVNGDVLLLSQNALLGSPRSLEKGEGKLSVAEVREVWLLTLYLCQVSSVLLSFSNILDLQRPKRRGKPLFCSSFH